MKYIRPRILAFAAATIISPMAWAHAMLDEAHPSVGAKNVEAPTEIRLEFSEGIEPAVSQVDLTDENGHAVALSAVRNGPSKRELYAVVEQPLAPGRYRVKWHVLSVDGHVTDGEFSFTVAAAAQ